MLTQFLIGGIGNLDFILESITARAEGREAKDPLD